MNLDVNEAARLFQSGLAGETEPLRRFGIDLSAAAVEGHAYAEGIAKAGKPLTEQQKVQARYSLLMKETAKTQGDFKNTSGGLANQQRILSASFKELLANLGKALLPIMTRFVNFLNTTAIPALNKLIGFLRDNPAVVYGFAAAIGAIAVGFIAAFVAANAIVVGIALVVGALVAAYAKFPAFRKVVETVFSFVKSFVLAHMKAISTAVKVNIAVILAVWRTITAIVGFVRSAFSAAKSNVVNAVTDIRNTVSSAIGKVVSIFRGLPGNIRSALSSAASVMRNIGVNMVNGLLNGIRSAGSKLRGVLVGLLPGPLKKFAGALGLASPSKLFAYYGRMTVAGYVKGIESSQAKVDNAISSLAGATVGAGAGIGGRFTAANVAPGGAAARAAEVVQNIYPQPQQSEREIARHSSNRLLFALATT